jgi:chromosome segregation ATPase
MRFEMVGMENLVPKWLGHGVHDMADDDRVEPPPIAQLPEPKDTGEIYAELSRARSALPAGESDAERDARIFGEAAVRTAELHRKIEAQGAQSEILRAEIAELRKELEAERKQKALYELELAETQNNLQTMAAHVAEYAESFQRILRECDRHGAKRAPKKNGKKNGDNGNDAK